MLSDYVHDACDKKAYVRENRNLLKQKLLFTGTFFLISYHKTWVHNLKSCFTGAMKLFFVAQQMISIKVYNKKRQTIFYSSNDG